MTVRLSSEFEVEGNRLVLSSGESVPFSSCLGIFEGRTVGIFQGTFDPPTRTHFRRVISILRHCDVALVYPTNRNSRKSPVPLSDRIEMLRLGTPLAVCDHVVIAACTVQPPFAEFIRGCEKTFGGRYTIAQGEDKLLDLPWYEDLEHPCEFLLDYPHLLFGSRGLDESRARAARIRGQITYVGGPSDLRSSLAREALREKDALMVSKTLSALVVRYILTHRLYGSDEHRS